MAISRDPSIIITTTSTGRSLEEEEEVVVVVAAPASSGCPRDSAEKSQDVGSHIQLGDKTRLIYFIIMLIC